jgi:Uncharacterized protein conserved in bacteria (DUF2066)
MPQSRLLRGIVAALLSIAGSFVAPDPGRAQVAGDVFSVSDIPVDVTASDAVTARQDALEQGQRQGLERLLRRLVPAERHARLPSVDALPIDRYVQSFEIADEEVSSTRYIADLTVSYAPEAVRDLLAGAGLPFAETASAPLVVLPLYEGPEGPRLWPEGNPWWQAWAENLDPERLLRLVLPLGDLEDMALVGVEQAQAGDPGALLALAGRYGSEDVLVVGAQPMGGGETGTEPTTGADPTAEAAAPPAVRLEVRRIGSQELANPPETIRAQPGQTLEALLGEAVRGLQDSLDEQWKSANLLRYDQPGLMVVDVPIARLSDWVRIQQGLQSLPEISEISIAAFARETVRARIRYIGDEQRLEQSLSRLGLALSREGESWRLLPMAGSPSQGVPQSATSSSF